MAEHAAAAVVKLLGASEPEVTLEKYLANYVFVCLEVQMPETDDGCC